MPRKKVDIKQFYFTVFGYKLCTNLTIQERFEAKFVIKELNRIVSSQHTIDRFTITDSVRDSLNYKYVPPIDLYKHLENTKNTKYFKQDANIIDIVEAYQIKMKLILINKNDSRYKNNTWYTN